MNWESTVPGVQAKALVTATRLIDQQDWIGTKTDIAAILGAAIAFLVRWLLG
jgi:hypothetical protein